MRRGEEDCRWFLNEMLERLNDPKNVAKGDYSVMSVEEIRQKLIEEHYEADCELWLHDQAQFDKEKAMYELADLAVCCMIGAVKVRSL